MQESLRTYLELAMGLTEVSRKKVKRAVKDAVGKGGATADQLKQLTTDVLAANSANRDSMVKLVRFEVDRALGMVGLATAEEVGELTARVRQLEQELADARGRQPGAAEPAHTVGAVAEPALSAAGPAKADTSTVAKKTVAKKAVAKKALAPADAVPAVAEPGAAAKVVGKPTTAKKAIPTADRLAAAEPSVAGPGQPTAGPRKAIPTADQVARAAGKTAGAKALGRKAGSTKVTPARAVSTKATAAKATATKATATKSTAAKATAAKATKARKAAP